MKKLITKVAIAMLAVSMISGCFSACKTTEASDPPQTTTVTTTNKTTKPGTTKNPVSITPGSTTTLTPDVSTPDVSTPEGTTKVPDVVQTDENGGLVVTLPDVSNKEPVTNTPETTPNTPETKPPEPVTTPEKPDTTTKVPDTTTKEPETTEHKHTYGSWTVSRKATCTADGQKVRKCSCGSSETAKIPATGHTYGKWTVSREATCTVEGQKVRKCSCGASETAVIPATGNHTYGEWTVSREATCTVEGQKVRKCSCGASETAKIPATGNHSYGEWTVSRKATCTAEGQKVRKCSCGKSETAVIPATGHSYGAWTVSREATCAAEGQKVRKCSCGASETAVIPATGNHTYGAWSVSREATCTTSGQKVRKCTCGKSETSLIPATGHNYSGWVVITKPTTISEGKQEKTCSNCGDVVTETIEKLPSSDSPTIRPVGGASGVGIPVVNIDPADVNTAKDPCMPYYERDTNVGATYTCTCATNGCEYYWNGIYWKLNELVYGVKQGSDKTVKIGNKTVYIGYPSNPQEGDLFYDSYIHRICWIDKAVSAANAVVYWEYDSDLGVTASVYDSDATNAFGDYCKVLCGFQKEIIVEEEWDGELWELDPGKAVSKYGFSEADVKFCFSDRVIYWINYYLEQDGADKMLEEMWYGSELARYRAEQMRYYTPSDDWHNQDDIREAAAACGYPDFFNGFAECAAAGWIAEEYPATIDGIARSMVDILRESEDHWNLIKSQKLTYVQAGIRAGSLQDGNPYSYVCCVLLATEEEMILAWPEEPEA